MTGAGLLRDRRGVTAVEFAIVAPVLCLLLVGGFDVAHTLYMRTSLQGLVQKTARDAALESGTSSTRQATLDQRVTEQVHVLAKDADVVIDRRYFRTFAQAAAQRPEDFTDTNHNGTCDGPRGLTPGEPYTDENSNGVWDRDGGNSGQGGARDKTLYTVRVSYPRMLPLGGFIDLPERVTVTAATVLANQPYAAQNAYGTPTRRNCP